MMKKFVLLIIIFYVFSHEVFSQENRFVLRSGAGYYTDVMGWYDGPVIWIEGGCRVSTGFYLNGRLSVSTIDWTLSDGMFSDYRTIALRQMADITFSRPVVLKGRHFLEPGFGFKLKREYHLLPDAYFEDVSGQTYLFTSYSYVFYEIGFTLCLDYYYEFKSNFFMGLRADSNVIWAVGFEGLTLSPLFGFRF